MVVANDFLTRKDKVVVITSNEKYQFVIFKTRVGDVVQNFLIRLIVERYSVYVEKPDL